MCVLFTSFLIDEGKGHGKTAASYAKIAVHCASLQSTEYLMGYNHSNIPN